MVIYCIVSWEELSEPWKLLCLWQNLRTGLEQALDLPILCPDLLKGNKINTSLLCYTCSFLEVFAFVYERQWLQKFFCSCCWLVKHLKQPSCRSDWLISNVTHPEKSNCSFCVAPFFSHISSLILPFLYRTLFHATVGLCILDKMFSDSSVRILSCITAIYSNILYCFA